MRSRPAHISPTDASTTADALPPPNEKGPHDASLLRLPLDKDLLHISSDGAEVSEARCWLRRQESPVSRQRGLIERRAHCSDGFLRRRFGCVSGFRYVLVLEDGEPDVRQLHCHRPRSRPPIRRVTTNLEPTARGSSLSRRTLTTPSCDSGSRESWSRTGRPLPDDGISRCSPRSGPSLLLRRDVHGSFQDLASGLAWVHESRRRDADRRSMPGEASRFGLAARQAPVAPAFAAFFSASISRACFLHQV
jgi:hypothetical protein